MESGRVWSSLRDVKARALLARRPVDAVIQIGSEYVLPPRVRFATLEDMTVPQAVATRFPGWAGAPPAAVAYRRNRQAGIYRRAAACCPATDWVATSLVDDYGVPPEKVTVAGFGRNLDPEPVDRDWTRPRFLFVGKDWERKNGPAVVDAFARVAEDVEGATLDLVGGHPRVDARGVRGHGTLRLGVAEDRLRLKALFESATCFVMPSLVEPAGIVYLEAAAAGVPSIGTTIGGAGYFIGDGGVTVDPHDPDALYRAMLRLSRAGAAHDAGRRALARSAEFTWVKVAGRILDALGAGF